MEGETRMLITGLVGARPPPPARGPGAAHDRRRGRQKKMGGVSSPTHHSDNDEETNMITRIAATPSISVLDPWRDVTMHVTFRTIDPINVTEIVVDPDPGGDGCLLQVIDAAITRLQACREAFMQAEEDDTGSLPPTALPVPWYAWCR